MDTDFIFISSQLPLNKIQKMTCKEILDTQQYHLSKTINIFGDSLEQNFYRSFYDALELYRFVHNKPLYNYLIHSNYYKNKNNGDIISFHPDPYKYMCIYCYHNFQDIKDMRKYDPINFKKIKPLYTKKDLENMIKYFTNYNYYMNPICGVVLGNKCK